MLYYIYRRKIYLLNYVVIFCMRLRNIWNKHLNSLKIPIQIYGTVDIKQFVHCQKR
jgi:hypothetical protein